MEYSTLAKLGLPDSPGIYQFRDGKGNILYIGKATSLRDRVRSYFANDLLHARGKHMVDMVTMAERVTFTETGSVLEAIILEAAEIKAHQPPYNTKEKDNKSFNYVVITNEPFPRVLTLRERTMLVNGVETERLYKYVFGPFPQGTNLAEALRIIRKIFPFRDTCIPENGKPCFNAQIGLCPGVCVGAIGEKEYARRIGHIRLFFEGKKEAVVRELERLMHRAAQKLEFEEAGEYKRMIFALRHIKDVSLISEEVRTRSRNVARSRSKAHRIEAYDIAHISGKYTVGVMVVVEDGHSKPSAYRKFKIRIESEQSDDTLHLEEVLRRRIAHTEWERPDLIVIDGGVAQKRRAQKVLREFELVIPVVSVVKDERHKPKAFLGDRELVESYRKGILIANAESHRFAVAYHRQLRDRIR
jgi:excinuclease ABC subunit C